MAPATAVILCNANNNNNSKYTNDDNGSSHSLRVYRAKSLHTLSHYFHFTFTKPKVWTGKGGLNFCGREEVEPGLRSKQGVLQSHDFYHNTPTRVLLLAHLFSFPSRKLRGCECVARTVIFRVASDRIYVSQAASQLRDWHWLPSSWLVQVL